MNGLDKKNISLAKPAAGRENKNDIKENRSKKPQEQARIYDGDGGKFKRILAFVGYRCILLLNANKIHDAIERNPARSIFIIFFGWFLLAVCSGWVLCCFVGPPNFLLNFYSNYVGYIKEYNLFCMSMMVAALTFPLAFVLLFCALFKTAKSPPVTTKILMMIVASLFIFFSTGIDGLKPIGRGGREDPRTLIILLFDWQGAVLLNIFLFAFFILMAVTSLKPKER